MEKAKEILKSIANEIDEVERCVTAFTEFGDFALTIRYIYYIKKGAEIYPTMDLVNMEILKRFGEEKLEFAYPTQLIYTKQV
jgi:MscS family membrane protein